MRLRTCRSAHLSLPVLRLLVTCMYANAGRLNTQLQHYRRVSPTGDKPNLTVGFVETSSSSVNESAEPKSISLSNSGEYCVHVHGVRVFVCFYELGHPLCT